MITKRILSRAALGLLLAAACWTLWAQDTEQQREPGGLETEEDTVRYQGDELRREGDMWYLQGNVVFSHKDIKLYCEKAAYNDEENTARAEGSPKVQDPNTTITGNYIDVDFDEEVAVITENVTAVTQRKQNAPEGAKEASSDEDEEPERLEDYWEKKTVITCDKIVYQYNEDVKTATATCRTATCRVKAVQEDKTVYADKAVYEELEDIITLTGDVRLVTDKGDEFRCPRVVISVEEDWFQAEAVVGVAKRREKEEGQGQEEQPSPPEEGQAEEQ